MEQPGQPHAAKAWEPTRVRAQLGQEEQLGQEGLRGLQPEVAQARREQRVQQRVDGPRAVEQAEREPR